MNDQVKTTRLPNGLTILTEHMPGLRSVTLGIWVRRGSRHELPQLNGICHFIEHALFKGTQRRTAHDIAMESDRLGGHLDAYTTHEMTGFSMKVVDSALPAAFDLVADMLANPRFDEGDLKREQNVIIEEMKMVEDTPEEFLGELFNAAYFPDHSLGRPIEGTVATVSNFDRAKTAAFHFSNYAPANLVIAAAGTISHEQLVDLATRFFGNTNGHVPESSIALPPAAAAPIIIERKGELEQAHLIIASPWPSAKSDDRYIASMLATIIGGSTSSRLWQSIREERGLAYSIGAGGNTFTDVGMFTIYAGVSPIHIDQVLDLSLHELRRAVREPMAEDELQLAKEQAVSTILLSLESSSARVGALARQEIVHGRRIPPDEIIQRIEAVTREDMLTLAQTHFTTDSLAIGALGNLNGFAVDRSRLEI
ncbi:MAG TPA: pitrilysin family protein [Pyrinomonadaceae bacterium]|nr:pitrilysin family protein [Pyrinomonadaceae bacterium]